MTNYEFNEFIELIEKVFSVEILQDSNGYYAQFAESDGDNPAIIGLYINRFGKLLIDYRGRSFSSNLILIRSLAVINLFGYWQININENFHLDSACDFKPHEDDIQRLIKICEKYNQELKEEEE